MSVIVKESEMTSVAQLLQLMFLLLCLSGGWRERVEEGEGEGGQMVEE